MTKPPPKPVAPRQETPEDMVVDLLRFVRHQFCTEMADSEWFKLKDFIRKKVIMWPAAFMSGKGFTITVKRYDQIMRTIFTGIKRHGSTGSVGFMPGYLMKCVQEHWRKHWEEYYEEAKNVGNLADRALFGVKTLPTRGPNVEPIAAALRVLEATAGKRKGKPARDETQSSFGF